jgi:hypothetical protein
MDRGTVFAEVRFLYVAADGREGPERPLFESKSPQALSDRRMFLSTQEQAHQRNGTLYEKDNV